MVVVGPPSSLITEQLVILGDMTGSACGGRTPKNNMQKLHREVLFIGTTFISSSP